MSNDPPIRPYHLTPQQLWVAYHEAPLNRFFAKLAETRLAMLEKELQREQATKSEESIYAGC